MTNTERFRKLLSGEKIIMAPGAYDALTAKLIADARFPAVYMTGYGVSASVLGKPDIGLISFKEMLDAASNMVNAAGNVPVIADADNGYGGALNVMRTVEAYEKAGIAAIQLEDQVTPKRCGHMEGKEIISEKEMVSKLKAAVAARKNPDFCIIARTDANSVTGFADALSRAKAYDKAGADIIFLESPHSEEEMRKACLEIKKPMLANMVPGGKTPVLTAEELREIGYKIAIYPVSALYTAAKSVNIYLKKLLSEGTPLASKEDMAGFDEFNKMIDLSEIRGIEKSFSTDR